MNGSPATGTENALQVGAARRVWAFLEGPALERSSPPTSDSALPGDREISVTDKSHQRDWWKERSPRRAGWLVTTVLLGIALVGASIVNYTGARAAYDTLNRGQIDILESAVRQAMIATPDDQIAMDSALVQHAEAGLRYIALLDGAGNVILDAGEPVEPVALPTGFFQRGRTTGVLSVEAGGRLRAFLPRLNDLRRGGGGFGSAPGFQPGPPTGAQPGSRTGPPTGPQSGDGPWTTQFGYLLIEFEPVVAAQLMNRAGRSLALGSVAAILLSIAAVGFWRQSVQYEGERREFEQRRRLSQLGEMSAVLAHEIRNPLASLKGNAQLLAERLPAGTRDRSKAERVVSEATRLEALTTDLLEFARSGPNDSRPSDPVALAEAAIEEISEGAIALDTSGAPELWPFDAERLRHALVNILRNAVQACPDPAPQLRIMREEDGLVFEVRDFGAGIPPGIAERLFDPFYTTRTNGTGLGLAVAHRSVEAHGGRIEAGNHPAGGALFRLVIPGEPG